MTRRSWTESAALVAALALAGCGGESRITVASTATVEGHWPAALCAREASWAADHAARILRYYGPGQIYPADVAFLSFKRSISRFEEHACRAAVLGDALKRRLTARERAELLTHLPATLVRTVRQALAAAG